MAYKMKGFSGFKDSPVKAVDAGLIKAADNMSRGLEDPTSLIGEGVLGFLKGYAEAKKIKAKKDLTDAIKGNNAYDNLPPPPKIDPLTDEEMDKVRKKNDEFQKQNKPAPPELIEIKLEPKEYPKNEEIKVGPPVSEKVPIIVPASGRRNKRNRRRNRERP